MIDQRLYPDIILGNGNSSQTVALYGCYMVSLLEGINRKGFSYSVAQFDDLLTDRGCFVNNVMLSSSIVGENIPEIFEEGRNEAWNDSNIIKYMNDSSYIVIGEVDGAGIGGDGQHFVLIDEIVTSDGKIKMTYISDPWGGLDHVKVTDRYNNYGNILSLRVFKVKENTDSDESESENMSEMYGTPNQYDLENKESMKVAVDELNKVQSGYYISKSDSDKKLEDQKKEYEAKIKEIEDELDELKTNNDEQARITVEKMITDLGGLRNGFETEQVIDGILLRTNWSISVSGQTK